MNPFSLQLHTSYPQPPDCAWISDCKFLSKKFRRDFLKMSLRNITPLDPVCKECLVMILGGGRMICFKKKLLLQKVLDVDVFELALCELVAHRHIHQAKPLGGKQRPTAEPLLSPLHHHLPSLQHCHHTFPSIVDKTKSRHISVSVSVSAYHFLVKSTY